MRIPFFFTQSNNTISIILTEWGFTNDEFIKGEGVLKKVFLSGPKSFIIVFKNLKNEVIEDVSCQIMVNNKEDSHTSNEQGLITINNMSFEDELTIRSSNKEFTDRTIRIKDKTEEVIIIDDSETLNTPLLNEEPVGLK